ncbi:MAG TPA: CBS domain-containing protein [Actinomycetes bacterium]|nr:CBS domain-containing protein [Actinomycetes bacterium]
MRADAGQGSEGTPAEVDGGLATGNGGVVGRPADEPRRGAEVVEVEGLLEAIVVALPGRQGANVVWQAPDPADDRPRGHRGAHATITEAARRMHTAGVKRLPVVDETGRPLEIVSRADLLKVFTRPDEAIRSQILSGCGWPRHRRVGRTRRRPSDHPQARHTLHAVEDSTVLLTVAKLP